MILTVFIENASLLNGNTVRRRIEARFSIAFSADALGEGTTRALSTWCSRGELVPGSMVAPVFSRRMSPVARRGRNAREVLDDVLSAAGDARLETGSG